MLLFFLCLASTTRAASYQRSSLGASSVPPHLCAPPRHHPVPEAALRRPKCRPAPSSAESGPGTKSLLSAGSRPAGTRTLNQRHSATLQQTASASTVTKPATTRCGGPATPRWSRFKTTWSLHFHIRSSWANAREPFFPNPMEGFLHAPG